MSWENIKDYQFSSSRYFKRDEIEEQELSLHMIDEKHWTYYFKAAILELFITENSLKALHFLY